MRWGYREAARLAEVTVTRADDGTHYAVVARVVEASGFMLAHSRPLTLVLALAGGQTWRRPIETCAINDEDGRGIIFRAIMGIEGGGSNGTQSNGTAGRAAPAAQ